MNNVDTWKAAPRYDTDTDTVHVSSNPTAVLGAQLVLFADCSALTGTGNACCY